MGNKVIVAVGVMVLVLIIIIFAIGYGARNQETAIVLTDKTEYTDGDIFKVKIENNLKKNVCFSSCYPYYL